MYNTCLTCRTPREELFRNYFVDMLSILSGLSAEKVFTKDTFNIACILNLAFDQALE